MTERIHSGPIDEAAVLAWAYDEDLLFCSQDEDLVLGVHHEHYPLLAKLAQDPACPKSNYCLSIMDFSLMFWVLRGHADAETEIRRTIGHLLGSDRPEVVSFIKVNELRLDLLRGGCVESQERAFELGAAALNGVSRNADISVSDTSSEWVIELSVPPFHRHKEWLTICKVSGRYKFKR